MWQFRDLYDAERGLSNPFDAIESTALARKEFIEHLQELGSVDLAITAHKQGLSGAARYGVDKDYVKLVYSNR
jgi:hypothetical protein